MILNWIGYYKLTEANINSHVPIKAGIYRLGIELKDGNIRCVYVGQSEDLESRMSQYLNQDTDNKCLLGHLREHICYFKVAEVSTQSNRDAGERALFNKFKPECNDPDKIPNVEPADINFDN